MVPARFGVSIIATRLSDNAILGKLLFVSRKPGHPRRGRFFHRTSVAVYQVDVADRPTQSEVKAFCL